MKTNLVKTRAGKLIMNFIPLLPLPAHIDEAQAKKLQKTAVVTLAHMEQQKQQDVAAGAAGKTSLDGAAKDVEKQKGEKAKGKEGDYVDGYLRLL